ncbi:hypothetical protein C482_05912 [Natrialba chahannaoensis JCM 10990]|uniref:Peptidase M50 n=1 Tax=Natrialba chahannaoensis JCM 10990 TaxID=1227492 RepID=M0ATM1_9EURY|nr:DUF3267 domain-containing protein [Natrialba chahannaoensis]ELZ01900.1 hypothetical protein C482_05912 [Natrialba chahannaoensis JCM 10990]
MLPEPLLSALLLVFITAIIAAAIAGLGTVLWIVLQLAAAPGVVVHEFAHAIACRLIGVRIHEVVYFRFGEPAGYVRHEQPERYHNAFVIGVAPFLVNTVVAFGALLAFADLVTTTGIVTPSNGVFPAVDPGAASRELLVGAVALAWLGLAIGVHAFPSTGDANALWAQTRTRWRRSPLVLLGIPFVLVVYVVSLLSWLWADVLYAIGLLLLAFAVVGSPLV